VEDIEEIFRLAVNTGKVRNYGGGGPRDRKDLKKLRILEKLKNLKI